MPRRPAIFRKSDLERALRAVKAAGLQVARIEIDQTGKMTVVIGDHATVAESPLDQWKASRARAS
jgi:hypothetical protein